MEGYVPTVPTIEGSFYDPSIGKRVREILYTIPNCVSQIGEVPIPTGVNRTIEVLFPMGRGYEGIRVRVHTETNSGILYPRTSKPILQIEGVPAIKIGQVLGLIPKDFQP